MTSYLIRRFMLMIPTFIGITLIAFMIMRLAPGDPAELRAAGGLGAAAGGGISVEKRGAVDEATAGRQKLREKRPSDPRVAGLGRSFAEGVSA
jgi:ABC-type microcin C transport system permease subunit YejB